MKKYWRRIQIITRPKEKYGFYEYFMDTRKKKYFFFPPEEPKLFQQAIRNIKLGENPSDWCLTKPSGKDKGIQIIPMEQNAFYVADGTTFFFPNNEVFDTWLNFHWKVFKIVETNEKLFGISVKYIEGELYKEDN